ncbi:hypothetical protein DPM35_06600 [Mesorhizobium atlanticum]|uniref:AAA+ ATPase domain-containing protein n=1 Tax=Mesorhizobium atlanticum TaxID=2233532 RepID=A0A330GUT2_9HYPH|nr:hypothetical protein DPM35_06600 [Mesorhizobium atlanticum]
MRSNLQIAIDLFGRSQTPGQKPSADVSEQRLRTWKKAFEDMGILTVREDKVQATRFGKAIMDGWTRVDDALQGANSRIALLGAEVANRIRLAPPGKIPEGVPEDSDLLPIRAIWRAFRNLNDRLHWQDVNRALGQVHYESSVPAAIAQIQAFRKKYDGVYDATTLHELGPAALSDDPRLITPWLNRASVGGLLFSSEADTDGFRTLNDTGRTIVDDLLAQVPPGLPNGADYQTYLDYLMEPVQIAESPIAPEDKPLVDSIAQAASEFGGFKFIVLSGLPGTGKTRLARLVAERLTGGDDSRIAEVQFHESFSYEDFAEGFVPRKDGSGFEHRPKVLRIINERAMADPMQVYVLIVEEFTRANSHSVLGELLTYIEHRGRPFQWSVSQEQSFIAPNLVVIASMNPRDKSALQLDAAVKRRMHIIPVGPSVEALSSVLGHLDEPTREKLLEWFSTYVGILPFGHGLFANLADGSAITKAWHGTIAPLLQDPTGAISPAYQQAHDDFPLK